MNNTKPVCISEEDSNVNFTAEEPWSEKDEDNLLGLGIPTQHSLSQHTKQSTAPTNLPRNSTSSSPVAMCVICREALARSNGADFSPTCGMTCASKLRAASGLPDPSPRRTLGPPNTSLMSLAPRPNMFEPGNRVSSSRSSEATRDYTAITRSYSRPNQIGMCAVCRVRPRCQRGGRTYPTCGLSCAAQLHTPGYVEMCDYCKKRPKAVANGKTFPQCGKTCRDKAKLAEAAAMNAAACTSCILCWKSTKSGDLDFFCSPECSSLADARAPFLIEIPRGHVAFKKVAEFFTSEWRTSTSNCPTIKRVYLVIVKPSFRTNFEKYRTKIGSQNGILPKKSAARTRWLVISRECGFADPGDLEPCSSKKCLLCCIVRSSFRRLDFPSGITTSGLNRTVERYRGGRKASSKIAALAEVVVGREARMTHYELQDDGHPKPPPNADSVHVIGVRNGSEFDLGDIVVYDGDAVWPRYLISYN